LDLVVVLRSILKKAGTAPAFLVLVYHSDHALLGFNGVKRMVFQEMMALLMDNGWFVMDSDLAFFKGFGLLSKGGF
jgi:hypothetical protein